MLPNNWQRMNIILGMKNRFDYAEFVSLCESSGCQALPALEFAQKVGILSAAQAAYPETPVAEAYLTFIRSHQIAFSPPSSNLAPEASVSATSQGCSGCGGGALK